MQIDLSVISESPVLPCSKGRTCNSYMELCISETLLMEVKWAKLLEVTIPESCPLTNICTAWPVDWMMRVGSSPPCKNDSVAPTSTLHTNSKCWFSKCQNSRWRYGQFTLYWGSKWDIFCLPGHVPKIIACVTRDIYLLQESMSGECGAVI